MYTLLPVICNSTKNSTVFCGLVLTKCFIVRHGIRIYVPDPRWFRVSPHRVMNPVLCWSYCPFQCGGSNWDLFPNQYLFLYFTIKEDLSLVTHIDCHCKMLKHLFLACLAFTLFRKHSSQISCVCRSDLYNF